MASQLVVTIDEHKFDFTKRICPFSLVTGGLLIHQKTSNTPGSPFVTSCVHSSKHQHTNMAAH